MLVSLGQAIDAFTTPVFCAQARAPAAQASQATADSGSKASTRKAHTTVAGSTASEASSKNRRKRTKKSKSTNKHLRQFLTSVTVDEETFRVGDSAYLRMSSEFDEDYFTDVELCQECHCAEPEEVPVLECNKCLLGFHLTCLRPPLAAVPKVSADDKLIQ